MRLGIASAAVIIGAVISGCGGGGDDDRLAAAVEKCQEGQVGVADEALTISEDDSRVLFQGLGGTDGLECVLDELEAPDGVSSNIFSSTSDMGEQREIHDGLVYTWTGPVDAIELTITEQADN